MRKKTTEKALEAVRLMELDGRKVYKVVLDGQKIELLLDKGAAEEDDFGTNNVIDWS
jgi:hypothetical protein